MAFFFNSSDSSNDLVDVNTHINIDGNIIIQFGDGRDGPSHLNMGVLEAKLLADNLQMVIKELIDAVAE